MRAAMSSNRLLVASLIATGTFATAASAFGQTQGYDGFRRSTAQSLRTKPHAEENIGGRVAQAETAYHFKSRGDSTEWARNRALADRSTGFRVIVSLQDRHVWAVSDEDTLLSAPAAVAKGTTINYSGREFTFDTPRGLRHVLNKDADPIWNPPDWLYIETAKENGLKVARIPSTGVVKAP